MCDNRPHQSAKILAEAFGLGRVEVHPALLPHAHAPERVLHLARERGVGWPQPGHDSVLARAGALALELDEPLSCSASVGTCNRGCARPVTDVTQLS